MEMILEDYKTATGLYTDLGVRNGMRVVFENPTGAYFRCSDGKMEKIYNLSGYGLIRVDGIDRRLVWDSKKEDFLVSIGGELLDFDGLRKYEQNMTSQRRETETR